MRSFTVDVAGPVLVAEWGEGVATFVLVHGLAGSHLNWMTIAPRLAERGRVLAPDLPGFGGSPAGGRPVSLAAERALLHRLLRLLTTGPVILVGSSMGGLIALAEAGLHPERVAGLVLADPAVPVLWRSLPSRVVAGVFAAYTVPPLGRRLVQRYLDRNQVERVVDGAFALCTAHPERVPGGVGQAHIDLQRERQRHRPENDRAFVDAARSIVTTYLLRRPANRLVGRVTTPTLVIHGEKVALVRVETARQLALGRPDWEVRILEDAGHLPMLEAPERFLAALESWLDRRGLAPATGHDRATRAAS